MPAGVSWPTYLKFFTAAGLSMFAGSHTVHTFYRYLVACQDLYCIYSCSRPLDDMEAWFQRFEAEEQRQRVLAQALKESIKAAEGGDHGKEKTEKEVVEKKVDKAVA